MPCGLIFTVLAAHHFCSDARDDISLANTMSAIADAVKFLFCVYNPVDPAEELTARLSEEQKTRFQDAISDAADDGKEAIDLDDRHEASNLWRRQFGDRFPLVEKEESSEQKKQAAAALSAFHAGNNPSKPWGYR